MRTPRAEPQTLLEARPAPLMAALLPAPAQRPRPPVARARTARDEIFSASRIPLGGQASLAATVTLCLLTIAATVVLRMSRIRTQRSTLVRHRFTGRDDSCRRTFFFHPAHD